MRASKKRRTPAPAKATRKPVKQRIRAATKVVKKAAAKVAKKVVKVERKAGKSLARAVKKIVARRPSSSRPTPAPKSRIGAVKKVVGQPPLKVQQRAARVPDKRTDKRQDKATDRTPEIETRAPALPTPSSVSKAPVAAPRHRSLTPREQTKEYLVASHQSISGDANLASEASAPSDVPSSAAAAADDPAARPPLPVPIASFTI